MSILLATPPLIIIMDNGLFWKRYFSVLADSKRRWSGSIVRLHIIYTLDTIWLCCGKEVALAVGEWPPTSTRTQHTQLQHSRMMLEPIQLLGQKREIIFFIWEFWGQLQLPFWRGGGKPEYPEKNPRRSGHLQESFSSQPRPGFEPATCSGDGVAGKLA